MFYLLTMDKADATLKVPEAERRLTFFINSVYMGQLPVSESVLAMPSFAVITPQYNEAVLYGKGDFLSTVNKHGVSPMVYLKSIHAQEWSNFCERLGVRNESEAWKAERDALGVSCSGEMEVRLWASYRGQTLARTVRGMMQYARAIRLLATLQLEWEYAALEAARAAAAAAPPPEDGSLPPDPTPRRTQQQIEEDAAHAALWFTAQRFSYICCCQRYYEHGEDDVRRR